MAHKFLVEEDIEFGKQLVQKLDERHVQVDAALWSYNPDSERYQLVIASGTVEQCGARPLYESIQAALQELPENQRVRFSDIAVTSPSTGVVATLSHAVQIDPDKIGSLRLTGDVVNQELIDDAYIYRMNIGSVPADSDGP